MAVSMLITPDFSFSRHDNFESIVPTIIEAHSFWLDGKILLWNHFQNLGEPLLANSYTGVFYLPYTLATMPIQHTTADSYHFMMVILLTHMVFAGIGWFLVLTKLGLPSSVSYVSSIMLCTSEFIQVIGTVWVCALVDFSWMPWILFGAISIFKYPGLSSAALLTAVSAVGHPQFTCYIGLWIIIWSVLFAFYYKRYVPLLYIQFCFYCRHWFDLNRHIIPACRHENLC
jgi:hypothetical protein